MKKKQKKPSEPRLPKTALNVVREVIPGWYQVYQIYGGMTIPLLGRRIRGEFVEDYAVSIDEAFERLNSEYYERSM